jgi:hypothetical protein
MSREEETVVGIMEQSLDEEETAAGSGRSGTTYSASPPRFRSMSVRGGLATCGQQRRLGTLHLRWSGEQPPKHGEPLHAPDRAAQVLEQR